jgi:hypothetical protein
VNAQQFNKHQHVVRCLLRRQRVNALRRVAPRLCTLTFVKPGGSFVVDERVGQCRSGADQAWLTALNQLQPTYVGVGRQAELAPRLLTVKAGTLRISGCTSITGHA